MPDGTLAIDQLVEAADELYAAPAEDFVTRRDAAAKGADDKSVAAAIKKLRKPSIAAWAINVLVREEHEQIDQVLGLGESLRDAAAALDGEELRALTRQRRQLTTALASAARTLARDRGVRLTPAVVDQVEGMLTAAMLDAVAADVVRSGMVLTAFTSTGVGDLDVGGLVAVPEALGHRAAPAPEPERPALTVVHPDQAMLREAAADKVAEAQDAFDTAQSALTVHQERVGEIEARRLQTQAEIDEIRRRVAELEDTLEEVDEQLESAEAEREEATEDLAQARTELESAQSELDALD